MAVKAKPDGYHSITPYLVVDDVSPAELKRRAQQAMQRGD